MNNHLIFDVDGTLVDSSSGILESLSFAFASTNTSPSKPLSTSLIGPPLREILYSLCNNPDEILISRLCAHFRLHYDSIGFNRTVPFPGVEKMLRSFVRAKIALHIVTNKRQRPTSQILDMLGWRKFFDNILSPDSKNSALLSKACVLRNFLRQTNLQAEQCLYIGDRFDDFKAAQENAIPFALAEWGFEEDFSNFPLDTIRMRSPDAIKLMNHLNGRKLL